jgi:hypothetical protein
MVLEWIFESRKCGDVIANVDRVKSACESVTRAANYMARFWLPIQLLYVADEVLSGHLLNDSHSVKISNWLGTRNWWLRYLAFSLDEHSGQCRFISNSAASICAR